MWPNPLRVSDENASYISDVERVVATLHFLWPGCAPSFGDSFIYTWKVFEFH